MMINKRLINAVKESKKYIAWNVILQWCSLLANIAFPGCWPACLPRGQMAGRSSGRL